MLHLNGHVLLLVEKPANTEGYEPLAGADKLLQAQPDLYDQLQHHGDSKWEGQILLDVDRTYPNHIKFREVGGEGQRTLFRILRAYSIHDSEVGYCQGIGFLAAFLMVYMSEIKVFWMLCAIMRGERFNLCHMYTDGMKKARFPKTKWHAAILDFPFGSELYVASP